MFIDQATFFCFLDFFALKKQNDVHMTANTAITRRANVVLSPVSASLIVSLKPKKLTVSVLTGGTFVAVDKRG